MFDDKLLNYFEYIAVVAIVCLLISLLAYQRKNPLKFYHEGQDDCPVLRRQSPVVYAAVGVIFSGTSSFYGVIGEPFEIIGYVDKQHQSQSRSGVTHILVIRNESDGVLHYRVTEEFWLSQHTGSPL